ncbi:MAG TPA: GNAT family N-acetyltransferase [Acidimicrobiales bacterium]
MGTTASPVALQDVWPVAGLVVRTPRIELRWPSDDDLVALAELAADGVHAPDEMPFSFPWTRGTPTEVRRRVLQFHWQQRGAWTPEAWNWNPVVVADGRVVGTQGMFADDFAVRRTVATGSWLGRRFQGQGIGSEMRRAVLHLAFAGLGADRAVSDAYDDNAASLAVTRRLRYRPNGERFLAVEGQRKRALLYALDRPTWAAEVARDDVELEGLEPCLELFGAGVEGGAQSG